MSYVTFLQSKDIIRWEGVFDLHTNNIHQLKKSCNQRKKNNNQGFESNFGGESTNLHDIRYFRDTSCIYYLYYVRYLITNCIFLRDLKSGIWDGDFFLLNRFPI